MSTEIIDYKHRNGQIVAVTGRVIKDKSMARYFSKFTLKNMFWAQFEIDYAGG